MKKKNAQSKAKSAKQKLSNTNLAAQRERLLKALRLAGHNGITTIQAREDLNIMMPAARTHELRHDFRYNIQTLWTKARNAQGLEHRVARYVLFPGTYQGVA